MFLSPDSVARSKLLKRHEIVSRHALPLKNKTHFCRPFHSCFRSNLLVYLEREQNTEPIFDQDRLGGGIDQVRLGARRCGAKSTQKSQVHGSTELGPPGCLEPPEPMIRQLAGSKWQVGRLDFQRRYGLPLHEWCR